MVRIKKGTLAAALLFASVSFGQAAFATPVIPAQQEQGAGFSNEDLQKFIEANTAVTEIKKENRTAMVEAIEEQGLSLERFNELAKAHRSKKLNDVAEGPEEIGSFSEAAQVIAKMQPEVKTKVSEAVEAEGLTMEQYNSIMKAYQSNPAVQEQIRKILAAG